MPQAAVRPVLDSARLAGRLRCWARRAWGGARSRAGLALSCWLQAELLTHRCSHVAFSN